MFKINTKIFIVVLEASFFTGTIKWDTEKKPWSLLIFATVLDTLKQTPTDILDDSVSIYFWGLQTLRQTRWLCEYICFVVLRHPDRHYDSVNISTLWSTDTQTHLMTLWIYLLCGLQTPRHTRWLCEYIYFMVTHYMNVAVCKQ